MANLSGSQTLYSLAECTPDLSNMDCNLCLESAITEFSDCCRQKEKATRASSLLPSCNVQYGLTPFYNKTTGEAPGSKPRPRNSGLLIDFYFGVSSFQLDLFFFFFNLCYKLNLRCKEEEINV